MKIAVFFLYFLTCGRATSLNDENEEIVSYENNNIGLGNYKFSYLLSDGTERIEEGQLKNEGMENEALSVTGSYSWQDPDGIFWTVEFSADENGFRPKVTFACLFVVVLAAPADQDVQIISYENDNIGLGSYRFAYDLSDGTRRSEQGELKNAGTDNEAMSVTGSYTWKSPDGIIWTVEFLADENGFQPKVTSQGGVGISGPVVASLLG